MKNKYINKGEKNLSRCLLCTLMFRSSFLKSSGSDSRLHQNPLEGPLIQITGHHPRVSDPAGLWWGLISSSRFPGEAMLHCRERTWRTRAQLLFKVWATGRSIDISWEPVRDADLKVPPGIR